MSKYLSLLCLSFFLIGASAASNSSPSPSSKTKTTPLQEQVAANNSPSSSDSSSTPINLKDVMSSSEQQQTGVDQLSSNQIQALQTWITQYVTDQKQQGTPLAPNALSMVLSEGHYVKLGSGTVWTISPNAWIYTYYWQKGDVIEVGKSQDTLFPVSLTNKSSGQSVNAKQSSNDVSKSFNQSYSITKIANEGQFVTLSDGSSWQIEPSARYMTQGWSTHDPIFVVQVKNSTGSPYELYNGATARSVFATQVKAPLKAKKAQNPTPSSSYGSCSSTSQTRSKNNSQKPQS